MKIRRSTLVALVTLAGAHLAVVGRALADTKDRCIAESEAGQRLALGRHFVEARAHLAACGHAACPGPIVRDCTAGLREAEASIASVVLQARLDDGTDVSDVKVFVDDAAEPYRPTGAALDVDPGPHTFRFERPSGERVVREVTVEEGAHLKNVTATFPSPRLANGAPTPTRASSSSSSTSASSSPAAPTPTQFSTQRTLAIVAGGAGIVGLGVGALFVALATSSASKEQQECPAANCAGYAQAQSDYQTATRSATESTVAFTAGAVLLAAGVVLWLTAPTAGVTRDDALRISPAMAKNAGGLVLGGSF